MKNGTFLKKRKHGQQGAPQGYAIELERRAKIFKGKGTKVWLGEKTELDYYI